VIIGRGDRLLAKQLDREGSIFFLSIVEKAGIRVALKGELAEIGEGIATLADGRGFEAAAVVFAAGIKSDFRLAQNMGVECKRAIVVNEQMATSLPDVWAAGDCVEFRGRVYGLWTASMAQGAVAGACAAGGEKTYQPEQPSYTMNAMGTKVWSYGNIEAEDGAARKDTAAGNFTKLFFSENKLVGAEMIGDISRMLALKKAVEQGMDRHEAEKTFLPKA
jgi:NAD(P)H-nitrite reductase large subunit